MELESYVLPGDSDQAGTLIVQFKGADSQDDPCADASVHRASASLSVTLRFILRSIFVNFGESLSRSDRLGRLSQADKKDQEAEEVSRIMACKYKN